MANTKKRGRMPDFRRAIPAGMQAVEVSPETGLVALQRLPVTVVTEDQFKQAQEAGRSLATMMRIARQRGRI